MNMSQEQPPARKRASRFAIIGLVLIVGGLALASAVDMIFPGQDPAGKAMAAGLIFFAGLLAGIVALITASILAIRKSRKRD